MGKRRTAGPERLTPTEASYLRREQPTLPQHAGTLALLDGSAGLDYDRLVALVDDRIGEVAAFRQRVRTVPGHLADPVWVDDSAFDVAYHVRRSSLPHPGSEEQLLEFCARIQSRLLDRDRPLWEIYLVEGLADGRVALITKTHHALLVEHRAVDVAELVLDSGPGRPTAEVEPIWMPRPEPSRRELVRAAVAEAAVAPAGWFDPAHLGASELRGAAGRAGAVAGGVISAAAAVVRRSPASPLAADPGERRRIAIARTRLDDYRQVCSVQGGTVNDVVLATVTGALRGWLLFRNRTIPAGATVRALVPVDIEEPVAVDGGPGSVASASGSVASGPGWAEAVVLELPIGEPDPVLRLARIGYALDPSSRRPLGVDLVAALGEITPPPLHTLAVRAGDQLSRHQFQIQVTHVPGGRPPASAAGAQLTEIYPLPPLRPGRAVAIGVTSYDGGIYFGVNGDADTLGDAGVVAALLEESLSELLAASPERGPATGRRGFGARPSTASGRGRSPRSSASPTALASRRRS